MITSIILVSLATLLYYLYRSIREKQRYFERLGIPHDKPVFFFGNCPKFFLGKENMVIYINRVYTENPDKPLFGVYVGVSPIIIPRDPELIAAVLAKNFSDFHDRGMVINEEVNPLEGHIFNLPGNKWKILRSKLTPTFTSGKIKGMLSYMEKCVDVFLNDLEVDAGKVLNVKNDFMNLSSSIIGSCTFGIEVDSVRNQESDFTRLGIKIIQPDLKEFALMMIRFTFRSLDRWFKFQTIPREVNDFFFDLVKTTMDHRKKSGYSRSDFLQLLLELREKGEIELPKGTDTDEVQTLNINQNEKLALTDSVLTAQAAVFIAAGFETTSTALAFICYELSKHAVIQDKLREHVLEARDKHGGFTYDAFKEMNYLDAVINETLRLWPPVGALIRECTSTTQLGGFKIEKGTLINIPINGLHRDPLHFPDPDSFKPERFMDQPITNYTFIPFGSGPRNCIGERFARLELKMAISKLLSRYVITTCSKMASVEPIQYKVGSFVNVPKDGIFCTFYKIDPNDLKK